MGDLLPSPNQSIKTWHISTIMMQVVILGLYYVVGSRHPDIDHNAKDGG